MSQDEKKETEPKQPPYDFAGHFANVRNVADLMRDPDHQAWISSTPSEPEHHQYVIWLGCNVTKTAHIAESLNDILRHAGADFVALGGPDLLLWCRTSQSRRKTGRRQYAAPDDEEV